MAIREGGRSYACKPCLPSACVALWPVHRALRGQKAAAKKWVGDVPSKTILTASQGGAC